MAQSEKEKKEEQVVRQPAQSGVLPQYAEQTAEAARLQLLREQEGVYGKLKKRLQTATENRNRAARRWRDTYEKTGEVMRGFIPKPKDTGDEQRRLKRIALGQAIGQLVGAIGAGVVGATTEGWTPAPSPSNLYNGAAARLQQLRQEEDADRQTYANLMARLQREIEQGQYNAAKDELGAADKEVKNLEALLARMQIAREQIEAARQRNDANNVARAERTEATNESQERRAVMRQQGKSGASSLTDNATRILGFLLPSEKTTTRSSEDGTTTTTQPYQSYNKQLVNAMSVVAKQLDNLNVAPNDASRLQRAIEVSQNANANWDNVILALSNGYSVDDIIARL